MIKHIFFCLFLLGVLSVHGQNPVPEWSKNATIYEVNIRQFTPEGTFKAFAEHVLQATALAQHPTPAAFYNVFYWGHIAGKVIQKLS